MGPNELLEFVTEATLYYGRIWTARQQCHMKSENFQYNTLGRWDDRLIDHASDVLGIIFFIISCKIICKNPFNLYFYNFTKIKIKCFVEIG